MKKISHHKRFQLIEERLQRLEDLLCSECSEHEYSLMEKEIKSNTNIAYDDQFSSRLGDLDEKN